MQPDLSGKWPAGSRSRDDWKCLPQSSSDISSNEWHRWLAEKGWQSAACIAWQTHREQSQQNRSGTANLPSTVDRRHDLPL